MKIKKLISFALILSFMFALIPAAAPAAAKDAAPFNYQTLPFSNIVSGDITADGCTGMPNVLEFGRVNCGNCESYLSRINQIIGDYSLANKLNVLFFDIDQSIENVKNYMQQTSLIHINAFSGANTNVSSIMWDFINKAGLNKGSIALPVVVYIDKNGAVVSTMTTNVAKQDDKNIISNLSLMLGYDITNKSDKPVTAPDKPVVEPDKPASEPDNAASPCQLNGKPNESAGDVLYTNIKAYINGFEIPVGGVVNGKALVAAEDLANYGFSVLWDGNARTLKVERNKSKKFNPMEIKTDVAHKSGTFKCNYLYTDIKTYLSGNVVESYAINGVTLIDFELLGRYGKITWDKQKRELRLIIN